MGANAQSEGAIVAKRLKPKKGTKFPTAWSVSRYNVWRDCAYKYLLKHVLKLPEAMHPAAERGIKIHKLLEELLKGNITGMPDELKKLKPEIMNLKKLNIEPEASWTLTKDFEQTHPRDWDNAWVRAKVDVHHYFEDDLEVLIVDLKTGRLKIAQAQMDLYAALAPYYYPDLESVIVELWFSDHGEVEAQEYTRKQCEDLMKKWVKRSDSMLSDRKFLPSPGSACRFCAYKSSKKMPNGEMGPCHEWKKTSG